MQDTNAFCKSSNTLEYVHGFENLLKKKQLRSFPLENTLITLTQYVGCSCGISCKEVHKCPKGLY